MRSGVTDVTVVNHLLIVDQLQSRSQSEIDELLAFAPPHRHASLQKLMSGIQSWLARLQIKIDAAWQPKRAAR